MLGNFLFKINFFKLLFLEHYHNVKWFGGRSQARRSVGPDLESKCLQRFSADDKIRR